MYRKEVNEQSPLRILEASIHGGLGKGNLGVVMARAGVGKTACLVQIALDDLLREKHVLHFALNGQTIAHVQSWYDAAFDDLVHLTHLKNRGVVRAMIQKGRIIQAVSGGSVSAEEVKKVVDLYKEHLGFTPATILIDEPDWTGSVAATAVNLKALKDLAASIDAELWVTARTHREETGAHPTCVTPPCEAFVDLIDVALLLEPQSDSVTIRLLKDHEETEPKDTTIELQPDTLRLVSTGGQRTVARMPAASSRLLSGGAKGAETAFGQAAEKWGVQETNYTFDGHLQERTRGSVMLDTAALQEGAVSTAYVQKHMRRNYPNTPLFQRILQSIWHQVNTAGQVFVVGMINEDGTVRGGTGWAGELARHFGKPLFVYDQEKRGWFSWQDSGWVAVVEPRITSRRFTGTGTRMLSEDGHKAIDSLFERSFG